MIRVLAWHISSFKCISQFGIRCVTYSMSEMDLFSNLLLRAHV